MDNNTTPTTTSSPTSTPPTPPRAKSNNMMMVVIGILVVIIAILGGYALMNNKKIAQSPTNSTSQTSMTKEVTSAPTQADSNLLTYTSADKKWQIMYPADAVAEKREGAQIGPQGIGEVGVIYKTGPTQTTGTEFHDGYSFTVGTMKKPAAISLEKFADEQIDPNPEAPVSKTPYENVTINGLSGISTVATGMATFKFVYLQAPNNPELVYYMAILAEGADKTTYQKITADIMQSFKLL